MRHFLLTCDAAPELPARAFIKALGRNAPATLEGGKGGGSPAAPDPWTTANATTASNQQTAAYNKALNLGNYSNPFGGQTSAISGYDQQTGAPIYQTDISANPQLQGAMNGLFGQIGNSAAWGQNAQNTYGQAYGDYANLNSGLTGLGSYINQNSANQYAQQGQDASYKAQTGYLDPQFSQQEESLKASLANQGLTPGSQAYNNAMDNFNRNKDFAYNQAANSAITQGQQMGLNQLDAQRQNIATQAGLFGQMGANIGQQSALGGQSLAASQLPYQNLQTIASMIPGYSGPATSGAQPADIAGYLNNQYQGQLAGYNAKTASNNQTMGTLGTLGGAAMIALGF